MRRLEFWFDYTCPYAYVASTQVRRLAAKTAAELVYQPMLLGGVFKANQTPQNLSEVLSPAKRVHNDLDFARWAALFGVPLHKPAGHPMRSVEALRATLATGCDPRVIDGFYRAYWVEGRPPSEEATVRAVVAAAGHDPGAVWTAIGRSEVKDDLRKRTDRAIELGIFGAPSFVVDGELYWGQDRMHFATRLREDEVLPALERGEHPARTLEVYWDFSSPFAYLGVTQARALAARTGAKLIWRPMLLGGLFKTIGQAMVPLQTWSEAKQRYYAQDLERWSAHWGVPFAWPSRFPMNSLKALRSYLALPDGGQRERFMDLTFRAYWAEDRDIADDAVLGALLAEAGAEPAATTARTQTPEVKQALVTATEAAAKAGVFGAPTWVVDGTELFWGQDRLPLAERALVR
jgi:2-hydroxychromene-2-carboxylate isomerase